MKPIAIALLFCAICIPACEESPPGVEPRLLEGPAEVVAEVESPEFVSKMLGCFSSLGQENATIIEYRDDAPVDAVMVQTVEVCFATHAHVSVGACLRDAMIDAGGVAP